MKTRNLILLLFPLLLSGEIIFQKGEKRDLKLLKEDRSLQSSSEKIYYLYGIKSEATALRDSGSLIIDLSREANISSFEKQNGLKFLRTRSGRSVFKIIDGSDTVLKSNSLWENPYVKSVSPDWIRKRKLH
jgi:hypothetical protein